jgi:putative tryptophan/tyrosine transport system substrate-binding protein
VIHRREFITLLSAAAATWPCVTRAEQPSVPVIGLLGSGSAQAQSEWTAAFLQRLRELGWSEGRNILIEYRWGKGHTERFSEIAAEFVQRKVTLILTHNTPPTLAGKRATSTIPSCSQRLAIRSALGSSQVWRDRVAISRTVKPDTRCCR